MKVILISEECHGLIGVADTPEHAIDFLMDEDWLNEGTTLSIFNNKTKKWEDVSMVERFGEHWGNTLRSAKSCDELNEAFCDCFFFSDYEVYSGED